MQVNNKIFLFSFLLIFLANFLWSSSSSSAVFLRINPSARTAGMGGVSVSLEGDVTNIETNPASLIWVKKRQIVLAHNEWFEDIRSEYLALAYPITESALLAFSGRYLYVDDLVRRDAMGNKLGSFTASDSVYTFSFAKILENLCIGINGKFIKQEIDNKSGTSIAGDLGVLYIFNEQVNAGACIKNIGNKLKIYKEAFPLPLTYSVGIGIVPYENVLVGFDIEKERNCEALFKVGGEYLFSPFLILRAGYVSSKDEYASSGVSAGLGIDINSTLYLDYAYVPYGDLGNTHRVSLKYEF
ncbi:PorV/PorQ family protein [bacterium]